LGRHARGTEAAASSATATAASTAAAVAATEIAAAAAVTVATTGTVAAPEAAAITESAAEIIFAKTVALVASAPAALSAAPSVKTHASVNFQVAPMSVETLALGCTRKRPWRENGAPSNPLAEKSASGECFWHPPSGTGPKPAVAAWGARDRQGDLRLMESLVTIFSQPSAWAALATLVVMEIVLGIDNLIFIAILSNKLPEAQRQKARRLGIGLALGMRLALLSTIAWLVGLTAPVFDLGISGGTGPHGEPGFETQFSWRDLILIAGGLFLLWKATKEIHHNIDPHPNHDVFDTARPTMRFGAAIIQILMLDVVFSIDSILTAVGMAEHLTIMVIAVIAAVLVMLLSADPLSGFIARNPTVVMLALSFLLMIGGVLIADGFGVHVPKGYIYAAMAFSAAVELLNIWARRRQEQRETASN
jgi:predicted tellurium resistance membrane protein TerC